MNTEKNLAVFALDGKDCLLDEQHLGIFNGMLTTNVMYRDALSFRGLYAPPYVSVDFLLETRLFGQKVVTDRYTWLPFETRRWGEINGLKVSSELVLVAGRRAAVLAVTVVNPSAKPVAVPVQFNIEGGLDANTAWEFQAPQNRKPTHDRAAGNRLIKTNNVGAVVAGTDLRNPAWNGYCNHWETRMNLPAKGRKTFYIVAAIGNARTARRECDEVLINPAKNIETTRKIWSAKIADLFDKVPTLHAKDKRLEKFYNRSLVHFLMNQWSVPEFKLHPYYSTGSVMGGCCCSYLWDFGNLWTIFPLYDPKAQKEHIKAFLSIDLSKHFAFLPMTGQAFGPRYYINQEKIIFHIYHYVAMTGDAGFLREQLNGKPIIDHVIAQALVGDDVSKPAVLVDYGDGNHHLELRKKERYDNVLPDMNGRRYAYYLAADELCRLAGKQTVDFAARAEALKKLLRKTLWSPKHRWFFWQDAKGNKQLRYTIQMFKLFGNPVLDPDQEKGLLGHWNEKEFLSDYGIHSMSKLDPAYNQADIDNGGGGSCSCFPGPLMEKLYRAGRPDLAEDLLRRILWWGDRLPYWSDSLVANQMDYRKDTPLQNAIGALSAAQALIFGLFGIQVTLDGKITINPHPLAFCPNLELKNLKLRNRKFSIAIKGKTYKVTVGGETKTAKLGNPLTFSGT